MMVFTCAGILNKPVKDPFSQGQVRLEIVHKKNQFKRLLIYAGWRIVPSFAALRRIKPGDPEGLCATAGQLAAVNANR